MSEEIILAAVRTHVAEQVDKACGPLAEELLAARLENARLEGDNATLTTAVDGLRAENAILRAWLEEYEPSTLFGMSLSQAREKPPEAIVKREAAMGRLEVVRWFCSGQIAPRAQVTAVTDDRPVCISYKTFNEAALRAHAEAATTQTWIAEHHEPENDNLSPSVYRGWQARLVDVLADVGNPLVQPIQILMGWTSDPDSGRNPADWLVPGMLHGWDRYNSGWDAGKYGDPETLFRACVDLSGDDGWALCEWGSPLARKGRTGAVVDPTGEQRADWLADAVAWIRDNRCKFAAYFDSQLTPSAPDYRLTDSPSQAAYRAAMSA